MTLRSKQTLHLLLEYFKNYEGAFEGNVAGLQRDYFILMSWLYFSPFICDLRSLALLQDSDVIRYPSFAIVLRQVQLRQDQPGGHADDLHVQPCPHS